MFDHRNLITLGVEGDLVHEGLHQQDSPAGDFFEVGRVGRVGSAMIEARSFVTDDKNRLSVGQADFDLDATFPVGRLAAADFRQAW